MNTEVKVKIVKHEKVNLEQKQVIKLAKRVLCEMYDWDENYYISKDGKNVQQDVEYHTSHSFDITENVRKATTQDHVTVKIFKDIQSFYKN